MVRSLRTWFPGAEYHLTSRGVRKSELFYDDDDRNQYLTLLAETKEQYPFYLHAYCLMTNHVHFLLQTIEHPPGLLMKHLHSKYAKYFNNKYQFSGHVFEKRYYHDMISSVNHELTVSSYIHLNPLEAGVTEELEKYPWSSYNAYILSQPNPLVTTSRILSYFPKGREKAYQQFIQYHAGVKS